MQHHRKGRLAVCLALPCLLFVVLVAAPSAGQATSQQAASAVEYGLSTKALQWVVTAADGSRREIEGRVARGVSLRANAQDEPRPVRALLMALPTEDVERRQAAALDVGAFQTRTNAGRFTGIDLRSGAAMVDLGKPADADHPDVRAAIRQGQQSPPDSGDGPGPRDMRMGFFPFWPMIITRSAVAGAEGTRLLVVCDTDRDGQPRTMYLLVEGASASIDWPENPAEAITLTPDQPVRLLRQGERGRAQPLTRDERLVLDRALEALTAGWAAAFPDDDR